MSLNSSIIFDIFYKNLSSQFKDKVYDKIEFLFMNYFPMIGFENISNITKGWCGIDTKLTIILINISERAINSNTKNIRNISLYPDGFDKSSMKNIYKNILNIFHKCCTDYGIKFDNPSFSALETILRNNLKK